MPVTQGQRTSQSDPYLYIHLEQEFAVGLYDPSNVSTTTPVVPAPLGAANPAATWCCMSMPQGGLAPLPKLTTTYTYTTPFPSGVTTLFITGQAVNPGINFGTFNELVMIFEGDNGTTHFLFAYSYLPFTGSAHGILTTTAATQGSGIFGSPYPSWTRARSATFTKAGTPVLVFPAALTHDANGNAGHVFVYPSPTARTAYGVKDLVTPGTQIAGQVFCYGARILVFSGIAYTWPGGKVNTNENIAFTTPPNSYSLGNQQTVLAPETPFGYGAFGSVSTGEFIGIKKQGGGTVVVGDIDAPSEVLFFPGIQPTGDFVGRGTSSTQGFYYCSTHRGAWRWNGGNTSQKVSQQLADDFFDCSTGVIGSNNYGFLCERWGNWVLFSNNYLFNETSGGWWVLYPTAPNGNVTVPGLTLFWFNAGALGNQMWASPLKITATTKKWIVLFTNERGAPHWQWQSLPIHVTPNAENVVDVRQVVLRCSAPDGHAGTVKVTIGSWTGTVTVPATATAPVTLRLNAAALGQNDIVVRLNADSSTGSAPIVHSLDIGYQVAAHVPVRN